MDKLPYARINLEGINCTLHGASMVPVMVQSYRPSASICRNDGEEENLIDDYNNCSEKDTLI